VDNKVTRQWKAKHILEAGLVISERREATMQVLEREVLAEFKRRVDKDPNASSSQKANMLLAQQQKEITGARVWKRFKEIKKIICLSFMPLLKDPIDHSGWDWNRCFEDLRLNLWVKEGKEKKKEVRNIKDCPDSFEPVEFHAFKNNHTHPKLAGKKGAAKIGADGNSGDDSLRTQLSSRKQQRTEAMQRERKKKRATIAENNSNSSSQQEHSLQARKVVCYENLCYMGLLAKAHGAGRPGTGVMMDKLLVKLVVPLLQSPAGMAPANMENDSDTVEVLHETTPRSPIIPRRVAAAEAEESNLANAHPAEKASLCVAGVCCERENPRIKLGELAIMCFECVSNAHPSCGEMTKMSEDATIEEFACSICITKMKEDELAVLT
jgi:hypothetical protein